MFKLLLPCAAIALLAGCASGPGPVPVSAKPIYELTDEPTFEVSYLGGLGEPAADVLKGLPEFEPLQQTGEPGTPIQIDVQVLSLSFKSGRELFGASGGTVGVFSLDTKKAGSLVGRVRHLKDCSIVSSPRLSVWEGQSGTIEISNEIAYIAGFEFRAADSRDVPEGRKVRPVRIADPIVKVARDGLIIGLRAERGTNDTLKLDFDIAVSEVTRPLPAPQVELPPTHVTLQTPVMFNQRLRGGGELGPNRVIVLTGLAGVNANRGQEYYVLLSARPVEAPDVPEDTSDAPEPKKD